ncbi:MAG: hypothetical protein DMG57_26305 [Acidobacteria bacterium]|nr:MAG: hypothetical protein DMG57_26305 [Acidobacteriota bacterium]
MQPRELTLGEKAGQLIAVVLLLILLCGAVFMARWNYKRGRGDRRGAFRLAFFSFCGQLALWLCRVHFTPTGGTLGRFMLAISTALFTSGTIWLLYLAVEPYIRRHWHQSIVSWTRLAGGQWRDPLEAAMCCSEPCWGFSGG